MCMKTRWPAERARVRLEPPDPSRRSPVVCDVLSDASGQRDQLVLELRAVVDVLLERGLPTRVICPRARILKSDPAGSPAVRTYRGSASHADSADVAS
jgi:hypothetical protein